MRCGVTRQLPLDAKSLLAPYFDSVELYEKGRPLTQEELSHAISDKEVFICQLTEPITQNILEHANRLRFLATFSTGVDHLDLKALKQRGIKVSHTPGVLTEATANLAWALILSCSRKLMPAQRYLQDGKFNGFLPSLFLGLALEQSTLGIVGMGKIGQAVAHRARAFGMKVIYFTRSSVEGVEGVSVSFEELLEKSDVISIHCPLTPHTKHLFNSKALSLMKSDAVLINTARGPIVNEEGLVEHLKRNPNCFVGLDVFENEPKVAPGLLELPNALCVPHIGSASRWAREQMARICIEDAMRFARGEKLQYEYSL